MKMKDRHITILGGGPAGLAAAYYARKQGLPFTIYEASNRIGGNAITVRHGDFLFDSGAHRFHDKDWEITRELRNLMGQDLKRIDVPSKIYYNHKFIDFPLSPLDLFKKLGLRTFMRACRELVIARMKSRREVENFEQFALRTYGKTIAENFLLNYSEKLWGEPCAKLSPHISGKRMTGLNAKTFLKEALWGNRVKTEHLDGSFYYPEKGFGTIVEKLAGFCIEENVRRNAKVTNIYHDQKRVVAIEINGDERREVLDVVSTLPLPHLVKLMVPSLPQEILFLANDLRFRNLIVVTVFLNKDSITGDGSIYFPDPTFPFTRVYEPKNRSTYMSPAGKTSLCAEIPCFATDELWTMEDDDLIECVSSSFVRLGWVRRDDILDSRVIKIRFAYPLLEVASERKSRTIIKHFETFSNIKISGRNGRFLYAHFHEMMRFGRDIIEEYVSS